ncbi:hypothetical protein K469DRAFT_707371 [Zopfia rhizophila CBS 207.26]|uniref:Uncharacterized protein n=1 Tax=Zopfia rhizophila CBS 207.26 TaxID=1314779 RepID=A0A6A6E538_9PEZI|nr:hypothetical protein K469DRAFT_707371 [Zopfia rhizophila CBS 207.26]
MELQQVAALGRVLLFKVAEALKIMREVGSVGAETELFDIVLSAIQDHLAITNSNMQTCGCIAEALRRSRISPDSALRSWKHTRCISSCRWRRVLDPSMTCRVFPRGGVPVAMMAWNCGC